MSDVTELLDAAERGEGPSRSRQNFSGLTQEEDRAKD